MIFRLGHWDIHQLWSQRRFHLRLKPTPTRPKATISQSTKPVAFSRARQESCMGTPCPQARPCHPYSVLFHFLKTPSSSMSATSMTLEERFDALTRQHELLFEESLVAPNKPNPVPINIKRYSQCQGLGHRPSDCPNKEIITFAE